MRNWNNEPMPKECEFYKIYYLPMRNWNKINVDLIKRGELIYYLPMRNWNKTKRQMKKYMHTIYYLPMRNWNQCSCLVFPLQIPFTTYLWGIETLSKNAMQFKSKKIYYLPMRNWNLYASLPSCPLAFNLLLTYEELKLNCIEPDDIADSFIYYLPMRNWNSQKWLLEVWLEHLIYYLPMRNWNKQWTKMIKTIYTLFTTYLWGIETWIYYGTKARSKKFTTYLWGIETLICYGTKARSKNLLLTYEELKLSNSLSLMPTIFPIFTTYLWGIETCKIQKHVYY